MIGEADPEVWNSPAQTHKDRELRDTPSIQLQLLSCYPFPSSESLAPNVLLELIVNHVLWQLVLPCLSFLTLLHHLLFPPRHSSESSSSAVGSYSGGLFSSPSRSPSAPPYLPNVPTLFPDFRSHPSLSFSTLEMSWFSSWFSPSSSSSKNTRNSRATMSSTHEAFSLPTSSPGLAHPDAFVPDTLHTSDSTHSPTPYSYPPQSPAAYDYVPTA